MSEFNFADNYRAAGLSPGPDIIRLRQQPFSTLLEKIDARMSIDLARMYFSLPVPDGIDWFCDAFRETDPSFSLHDNQREAAVLASCLLKAAISNGELTAALAPLTLAAGTLRQPLVWPEFLNEASYALSEKAIKLRQRKSADPGMIKLPVKSQIPDDAEQLLLAPDWQKTSDLFKKVALEAHQAIKTLANQTASVSRPLANDVQDLREEVEMLWWHIGGWSRVLDKPFIELTPALAAVMAGLDLADLSYSLAGPAAAPAILHRTIVAGRKAKLTKVSIAEAVTAFPEGAFGSLLLGDDLNVYQDVCPVLTAFAKSNEIGDGTSWYAAYTRATGITAESTFSPLELALQVYRERQLLSSLGE